MTGYMTSSETITLGGATFPTTSITIRLRDSLAYGQVRRAPVSDARGEPFTVLVLGPSHEAEWSVMYLDPSRSTLSGTIVSCPATWITEWPVVES